MRIFGNIVFVHKSGNNVTFTVSAWDGSKYSNVDVHATSNQFGRFFKKMPEYGDNVEFQVDSGDHDMISFDIQRRD